jgi:hypothetical protein
LPACRPLVTPFLREYDRDIAPLMHRRTAAKAPVSGPAAIGVVAGAPSLATLGQRRDQVPQLWASRPWPRPGHRKDVRLLWLRDQAQGLSRGPTGRSHHHDLRHPSGRAQVLQPLPTQALLVPTPPGLHEAHRHREATTSPTRPPPPQLEAKLIRLLCPVAGAVAHGRLTPPLRFERTIANQIQHAVGGGGSDRSVAVATSVITAWAAHCPDRTIRTVVHEGSVEGR